MKAVSAKTTAGLNLGANLIASDNSGAKIVRLVSVKGSKAKKRKQVCGKIADWVKVSVRVGLPDMKGKVFDAVIIRQKKSFRRLNGNMSKMRATATGLCMRTNGKKTAEHNYNNG